MADAQTFTVQFRLPDGHQRQIEVARDEYLLTAAYREDLDLPSMCLQGWCLTCAGRVEGPGAWDQSASRRYYDQDCAARFILLCTAEPRSNLVIRTHQRVQMRDFRLQQRLPAPRG